MVWGPRKVVEDNCHNFNYLKDKVKILDIYAVNKQLSNFIIEEKW